jgi:hypothetical protein
VEATETSAPVAKPDSVEAVAGEKETSPLDPITVEVKDVGARVLDESVVIMQELAILEMVVMATTPEI